MTAIRHIWEIVDDETRAMHARVAVDATDDCIEVVEDIAAKHARIAGRTMDVIACGTSKPSGHGDIVHRERAGLRVWG
jgi:hypothetical protein